MIYTRVLPGGTEYSSLNEEEVRGARREFILQGESVSLMAMNPSGFYVFDVYGRG